jgi:plastocyanin
MALRFALLACAALLVVAGTGAARAQPTFTVHTVRVTAEEYRFALATSKVSAGRVKFVIKNIGSTEHDFAIAGHTSRTIGPGQSTTMSVTLKRGTYPYRCTVDSHAELGMKGVLHVT